MVLGLVNHIQRFSVHDGPGIRTTIFLKGCQMRCVWCHNPETFKKTPEIQLFPERCIGCAACVEVCANGAIDERLQFDRNACVGCGACARACYAKVRTLVGKTMRIEEVLAEIEADHDFYRNSHGGVTISGGEPFCQPEFTCVVLNACKRLNIHTAVETNLAIPFSTFEIALPYIDLFMVDIKIWDEQQHRKWTGMPNRQTLENLIKISSLGKPILVRTPIIAGINDTTDAIGPIAQFLVKLATLQYYELLPYHPLGEGKRAGLGLPPTPETLARPTDERLAELREVAERIGITVRVALA